MCKWEPTRGLKKKRVARPGPSAVAGLPAAEIGPSFPYGRPNVGSDVPQPKTTRRGFLRRLGVGASLGAAAVLGCGRGSTGGEETKGEQQMPQTGKSKSASRPMPVLFVGHGSPMNAIVDNEWHRGFSGLGPLVSRPEAILAVSAHWYVNGTMVTADERPRTIHDFGGFPHELYEIRYAAPGSERLAARVRELLGRQRCSESRDWGLDHGTWSVLRCAFPSADVPVVQLSIDRRLEVGQHLELARLLAPLRHEGVLVFASGNGTHNLADAFSRMSSGSDETPAWARRFDEALVDVALERDTERLLSLWPGSGDGRLSHPSGDHYLPWVYAYGAADPDDEVRFPIEGFDMGSISMRSFLFG